MTIAQDPATPAPADAPGRSPSAEAQLQREALRRARVEAASGSPIALESTLSRISTEVMEEAAERLSRAPKPAPPGG